MSNELVPTPAPQTLFSLTDDLITYQESVQSLEDAINESQDFDQKAEFLIQLTEAKAALDRIAADLVTKTDSIAGVLRRISVEADFIKSEEQRLRARRKVAERADEWLRGYVLSVMHQRGMKQLKSASNTLFIRGSEAVLITDEGAVPDLYKTAAVKLPAKLWSAVLAMAATREPLIEQELRAVRPEYEVVKTPIKKAIKAGETIEGADLELRDSLCLR